MIGRNILKQMENAVTNIFRNFRRFFQNGDKIHSQLIFFLQKVQGVIFKIPDFVH